MAKKMIERACSAGSEEMLEDIDASSARKVLLFVCWILNWDRFVSVSSWPEKVGLTAHVGPRPCEFPSPLLFFYFFILFSFLPVPFLSFVLSLFIYFFPQILYTSYTGLYIDTLSDTLQLFGAVRNWRGCIAAEMESFAFSWSFEKTEKHLG